VPVYLQPPDSGFVCGDCSMSNHHDTNIEKDVMHALAAERWRVC